MNDLLSTMRLGSFQELMAAYKSAGHGFSVVLDGGAGSGETSKQMLEHSDADAVCYAFEPFPGNHRFFEEIDDPRISLQKSALANEPGQQSFLVSSVVKGDGAWGARGMEGYSSVGYLVDGEDPGTPNPGGQVLTVETVRADDVIDGTADFIKLDLQGGELSALQGMERHFRGCYFAWIEFSMQVGLLDYLERSGHLVFDTEYLFMGDPSSEALKWFDVRGDGYTLSTGQRAWFGYRKRPWKNIRTEFHAFRKEFGLVQTDLVCVNKRRLPAFLSALTKLEDRSSAETDAADFDTPDHDAIAAMTELDMVNAERDAAIAAQNAAFAERDAIARERNAALEELNRVKRYPWKYLTHAARQRMSRD